jgi:DNA helicase-2/ATP-dependent DNA helicase PcrA
MNLDKAKGEAFHEVTIFQGWPSIAQREVVANTARILLSNLHEKMTDENLQNHSVSITLARRKTTILTPQNDPCVLLRLLLLTGFLANESTSCGN